MALTIVSIAYPFAPVGPDAVGGAEQILYQLDHALVHAGHRSIVVACEGSVVAGTLISVPRVTGQLDENRVKAARARHSKAIAAALECCAVDLVHMHGIDFHAYMPDAGVPVLVTLHLPVDWYPAEALASTRPDTWLHCVSHSQHACCPKSPRLLQPIENGVACDLFASLHAKRKFALTLARICPEKGIHLAIRAAKNAGAPLLIAGDVFPYAAHQRYFSREIEPHLDVRRRFIGPIDLQRKRRLLAAARCLLVPSLAPETSSLVAREALASGTPVIAFPRGALVETVEHGRTGFLVNDEIEMAQAINKAEEIDPQGCRNAARAKFSLARMVRDYLALYDSLGRSTREPPLLGAA